MLRQWLLMLWSHYHIVTNALRHEVCHVVSQRVPSMNRTHISCIDCRTYTFWDIAHWLPRVRIHLFQWQATQKDTMKRLTDANRKDFSAGEKSFSWWCALELSMIHREEWTTHEKSRFTFSYVFYQSDCISRILSCSDCHQCKGPERQKIWLKQLGIKCWDALKECGRLWSKLGRSQI